MKTDVHMRFQLNIVLFNTASLLLYIYYNFYLLVHSLSLVPHLNLTSPVAGGRSCREDRMLGHTQAGVVVRVEGVQRTSVVVIIEVSGAGGAS